MRLSMAVFVIGNHLLRAGADNVEPRLPIGTIGGDAQLQDGVAMARVQAMLIDEHLRATLGHRLLEEAGAAAEIVDDAIQAAEQQVFLRRHVGSRKKECAVGK